MVINGSHVYAYWCKNSNNNSAEVKVGMHQGSALRPLQFVTVKEALSRELELPYHGNCTQMTWL